VLILNGLLPIPGRDGGGDERGAEEPSSRRVELRVRVEGPLMAWPELRWKRELEWLVLGLARGSETGLVVWPGRVVGPDRHLSPD
jgi:hypothetical protein